MLVFDVLGSLLDEDAGRRRAAEALDPSPEGVDRFVQDWSARFRELMLLVTGGQPYRTPEELYAQAAEEVARDAGLFLTRGQATELARFGRTLTPFPEVPGALEALARDHALVALTNAGTAQALAMSRHAGLRWTTLVSGEVVQAYKPDPRMYRYVVGALDLEPRSCVFVAAHPWDLDAAAEHGFRSAYLDRTGDGRRYDLVAPDLAALAPQFD